MESKVQNIEKTPFSATELAFAAEMKVLLGFAAMSLLIFIPAGDVYFGGVLLMCVLFIPMLIAGIILLFKNPSLLQKRLDAKEKDISQQRVVAMSGMMFFAGFILCGLDHRFSWLVLPEWVSVIFAVVFLAGYLMYAEVLRENTYLSRTVRVEKGQKVIDKGLYGIIRHPMYTATIIMFVSIPLVLGSVIALPVFLIYPVIIIMRLGNEEKLLCRELDGYRAYKKKVRYRLIPYIF